jgi:tRNA(Arg) A34 adenosine deaminase TadA
LDVVSDTELMSYIATLPPEKPLALMASSSRNYPPNAPFYSGVLGQYAHEAPAANILHNVNKLTHEMVLYLNYKPSDIELGMAWRAGEIKNVFFVESRNPLVIGQYKIDVNGFALKSPCELSAIKENDNAKQVALETSETRLTDAINPIKSFNQRVVSPETTNALGRGLHNDMFVIEDRDQRKIDEDFMRIAIALVDRGWNSSDAVTKPVDRVAGNNIGAIMVDKDNKIIGWGLNLKSENKSFHAETLMILRYLRQNNTNKLPDGARIYTSLECCPMCSAHITTLGKDIKVIYAQKDPYFHGENTLSQGKNHCSQMRTTLHFPDIFKAAMENNEDILDFLFSRKAKTIFNQGYQEAALFIELMEEVSKRQNAQHNPQTSAPQTLDVSSVLVYGEQFFQDLGNYTPQSPKSLSPDFFRSKSSSSLSSSSRSSTSSTPTQSPSPSPSSTSSLSSTPSSSSSPSPSSSPNQSPSQSRSGSVSPNRPLSRGSSESSVSSRGHRSTSPKGKRR